MRFESCLLLVELYNLFLLFMPHCVVEYSESLFDTIEIEQLLSTVHIAIKQTQLFDEKTIKIRAIPYSHYLIANQHRSFIAMTIKILAGRTEQQKRLLAEAVLAELTEMKLDCYSITVEVIEIQAGTYFKVE